MPKVIPSINESSFEEIVKKIQLVEPYVDWVHLDVSDGTFTDITNWHEHRDLLTYVTPCKIEVHLMVSDMDMRWQDWILPNVQRVIFHQEAAHDPDFVLDKIKNAGKEAGIAIKPETHWAMLERFVSKADVLQTLAVEPGPSGQKFKSEILDKITHIREFYPKAIIEVDGGINPETGKSCVRSGANILVSSQYIFKSQDIKQAILDLQNL
jgi:ribulose-phosphate 3-epimerase